MPAPFRFEYRPGTIRYGPGCVADLDTELDRLGVESALVVCGRTVGSTPEVIDPVREGLGDRLAGVFDRTTPEKGVATAVAAADRVRELGAGAVVGLGGGSSIDQAKVAAAVAAGDRSREDVVAHLVETGSIPVPEAGALPILAVPTTLAGADLSQMAGVSAAPGTVAAATGTAPDERVGGGVGDPSLMPRVLAYDTDLFRTTPAGVLTASAMNGFDKAVETPYARTATPVTDAVAVRSLSLLGDSLPALGEGDRSEDVLGDAVVGVVLAQYGVSRPDATTLSLVHAFGHAITAHGSIQQGAAHGIAAPGVLRYLFDRTDAGREVLAEGFGVEADGPAETAAEIVAAVEEVRDGLGLPAQLRSVDGLDRSDLPSVAEAVVEDGFTPNAPVDPTAEEMEAVLDDLW